MKVVAFNGSSRKGGNTEAALKMVLNELEKAGIDTKIIQIGNKMLRGCIGCKKCFDNQDKKCVFDDDGMNEYIQEMIEADGIILGSPVYFSDITPQIKALMDRAGYVTRANGHLLRRKVGATVAAVRRAGSVHTLDSMQHFMLINQMIIPGSSYWNLIVARDIGDAERDDEGVNTMHTLGENMAWLLTKIHKKDEK